MAGPLICTACGTQFAELSHPETCFICTDERQFVPAAGQSWTTLDDLRRTHSNSFRQHESSLLSIRTTPTFAIGQRAFLIQTEHGNVLWDCLSLVDEATVTLLRGLGGVSAIAISHPHFYTSMARWSEAFDAPVSLHAADRRWVADFHDNLSFWDGESQELYPGITLIRCGGHFAGSTVLHWTAGADGEGALFSGDTLQVLPDRQHVSFMRSYPNLTPLSASTVRQIAARIDPYAFTRIYGAFPEREVLAGGKVAVRRSVERYVEAIAGGGPADQER